MIGKSIKNRWVLQKKIGQGSFGEIYIAKDLEIKENVAVKVEKCNHKRETLKLEALVLKKLQISKYAPKYISCGRFEDFNFLVMELLGQNLSQLKRRSPNSKISFSTTLKLGIEMVSAIEDIHSIGFLHRDIKPSNFALRRKTDDSSSLCCILDFGLARKYVDSEFQVKLPRSNVGFRGTARYASIASHESKDLGRCDDLWSLFYLLIEFLHGDLPWKQMKEKDEIKDMKILYNTPKLCEGLPNQMLQFYEYLNKLKFEDEPDYNYLRNLLQEVYSVNNFNESMQFDFSKSEENGILSPRTITMDSNPANGGMTTSFGKTFSQRLTREFSKLSELKIGDGFNSANQTPLTPRKEHSFEFEREIENQKENPNVINSSPLHQFNFFHNPQNIPQNGEIELENIQNENQNNSNSKNNSSSKKCKCCSIF
ncbi:tau-tubulin kinase 1 [Anaeramoeba ignava]|uniref:Tau-tubulin kinase 1 n=1 Tax=Anaeramoeba ignava TaxID=1746090 RepID=A0A9Q0RGZ7_ANAIG|nr:tau-tubulin kinase 1 [Anaeramoeba ignava]